MCHIQPFTNIKFKAPYLHKSHISQFYKAKRKKRKITPGIMEYDYSTGQDRRCASKTQCNKSSVFADTLISDKPSYFRYFETNLRRHVKSAKNVCIRMSLNVSGLHI